MTKEAQSTLLKTVVGIVLMLLGVWGYTMGGKTNAALGKICFLIGFFIMAVIYGYKWLQ